MHKTMSATEARIHFGEVMRQVVEKDQVVIVERSGKPQVVIMPVKEYEHLQALQQRRDWEQALETMKPIAMKIRERRKAISFPKPDELIRQMREARDNVFDNSQDARIFNPLRRRRAHPGFRARASE